MAGGGVPIAAPIEEQNKKYAGLDARTDKKKDKRLWRAAVEARSSIREEQS